jgi:hypothetical protein
MRSHDVLAVDSDGWRWIGAYLFFDVGSNVQFLDASGQQKARGIDMWAPVDRQQFNLDHLSSLIRKQWQPFAGPTVQLAREDAGA